MHRRAALLLLTAYRRYLAERHREYREFRRLDRREQDEYWEWRHRHPDRDRDRR